MLSAVIRRFIYLYYRIRRKMSGFSNLLYKGLNRSRRLLYRGLYLVWRCFVIPFRLVRGLPWREESKNEPEQSENKPKKYSSDAEEEDNTRCPLDYRNENSHSKNKAKEEDEFGGEESKIEQEQSEDKYPSTKYSSDAEENNTRAPLDYCNENSQSDNKAEEEDEFGREKNKNEQEQSENKPPYSSDAEENNTRAPLDYSNENSQSENKVEEEDEFGGDEYRVNKADEFYCGYDSAWETEESESPPSRKTPRSRGYRNYKFSRFENAARDMWNYRNDYPNLHRTQNSWEQEHDAMPNLNFYLGRTPSLPDDVYIGDFHNEWRGDYDKLEYVHTFIQWLFPLQEPGMNYQAKPLTKQEIQDFLDSDDAKNNLRLSYELMLDFYGIKLKDVKTGEVMRATNWRERFQNLNSHTHNNLRITRILKCLGTLGYSHYQAPLVRFFLEETLINNELKSVKDSVLSYFVFAVLNRRERKKLLRFAYEHYEPKEEFVWCPKKIQRVWSSQRPLSSTQGVVGLNLDPVSC